MAYEAPSEEELEQRAAKKSSLSWKILPMLAITGLICAVLVHQFSDKASFWQTLQTAKWPWLILPLTLLVINMLMSGIRWRIILDAMGVKLGMKRAMSVILATWPFALITPSRASDLLRAVAIKDLLPISEGSSSVVAEKLVDVQSLCIFAGFGCLWAGQWLVAVIIFGILSAEWIVALSLLKYHKQLAKLSFLRKFEDKIHKLFKAFEALKQSPKHFILLSITSLLSWSFVLGIMYSLTLVFDAQIEPIKVIALWPASIFVGMLPLTVAGMGTRDAAFVALLGMTSTAPINEAAALASTFSYAIIASWLPAIVGLPWMIRSMHQFSMRPNNDEQADTQTNND